VNDQLELNWEGPFNLRDFVRDQGLERRFSCPGVYIWIEGLPSGGARLSYVGKASGSPTLVQRQRQHYANMIGGLYTIPREFRDSGNDWIPDLSRSDVAEVILYRAQFDQVIDEAFEYSNACEVYLAPLNSADEAKRVERQLLYDLQPSGTTWGKKSPPSSPISIIHTNTNWASPEIKRDLSTESVKFA